MAEVQICDAHKCATSFTELVDNPGPMVENLTILESLESERVVAANRTLSTSATSSGAAFHGR